MLTTALVLMLSAAPDLSSAFFNAGAPRRIRLVDDAPLAPPADYSSWSRRQLQQEYERIEGIRPGLGLPIGLIAGGGGAGLAGLYALFFSLLASSSSALPFTIVFGVAVVAGVGVAILGIIVLVRLLPERRALGNQLDEVEEQLRSRGEENEPRRPPRGRPDELDVPPPPPPPALPPPQVSLPEFPITLARF